MINRRPLPAPLFLPLVAWSAGIVLARYLELPQVWIPVAVAAVLLLAAIFIKQIRLGLLLVSILICGGIRQEIGQAKQDHLAALLGTRETFRQEIEFECVNLISSPNGSYQIRLRKLAGVDSEADLLFRTDERLVIGGIYSCVAELKALKQDSLLDIYPSRYSGLAIPLLHLKHLNKDTKQLSVNKIRASLLDNLDRTTGAHSGFAKALLLSDISSKQQYRERLTRGGLIHLIVVSGLHVWFIYAALMVVLRLFLPKRFSEFIAILLILGFAALNAWSAPVLRAALMIIILILSKWSSRPVAMLQVLSLSLWIITLIDPAQLFSISLQLSYLSVAVISLGVPRLFKPSFEHSFIRTLLQGQLQYLLMSFLVGLAILPVSLYYFGTGSMNGVIGNLVGVPLIGLILPVAFILMLIPSGWGITTLLGLAYKYLCELFLNWAEWVAGLPLWLGSNYLSLSQCLAACLGLLLFFLLIRKQWQALKYLGVPVIIGIALLLVIPAWVLPPKPMLYIFSSGSSDCALFRFDNDTELMIDTAGIYGSYNDAQELNEEQLFENNWMQNRLLRFLAKQGIKELDWLVITHMHNDHYGGLASLCRAVKVSNILISDESYFNPVWQHLDSLKLFSRSKIHIVTDTLSMDIADARLIFLHPDRDYIASDENNRSLVLKVEHLAGSYLFTSDIEAEAENYLVRHYGKLLKSDYLKVPHHGSRSSSTQAFIDAVKPQYALITAARRNRYGFPHTEVLQRYHNSGASIHTTANGSLVIPLESPRR